MEACEALGQALEMESAKYRKLAGFSDIGQRGRWKAKEGTVERKKRVGIACAVCAPVTTMICPVWYSISDVRTALLVSDPGTAVQ